MIQRPGRKPTKLEIPNIIRILKSEYFNEDDKITIHHITEDTDKVCQLEVEVHSAYGGNVFRRIFL